jgi:hypothetical protein
MELSFSQKTVIDISKQHFFIISKKYNKIVFDFFLYIEFDFIEQYIFFSKTYIHIKFYN